MDVKNLLNKELQAAKQARDEKKKHDAALGQEAERLFQPIGSAAEQVKF